MQNIGGSTPMFFRVTASQICCSGFCEIFPVTRGVFSLAQMWRNPVSRLETDLQTACCESDNIHILNQSEKHFHSNWKDLVLSSCYVLEVGLKLVVHRGFFFWNSEWAWNGFDFLLVLFSIVESPGFAEMFWSFPVGKGESTVFLVVIFLHFPLFWVCWGSKSCQILQEPLGLWSALRQSTQQWSSELGLPETLAIVQDRRWDDFSCYLLLVFFLGVPKMRVPWNGYGL